MTLLGQLGPGFGLELKKDHARQKGGMKRPCWTQTAHEKNLAGPNRQLDFGSTKFFDAGL